MKPTAKLFACWKQENLPAVRLSEPSLRLTLRAGLEVRDGEGLRDVQEMLADRISAVLRAFWTDYGRGDARLLWMLMKSLHETGRAYWCELGDDEGNGWYQLYEHGGAKAKLDEAVQLGTAPRDEQYDLFNPSIPCE